MSEHSILLTGGCGFIGSNLILELLEQGFRNLTVVDRKLRPEMENWALKTTGPRADLKLFEMDIRSPELRRVVEQRKVTVVIHLAALHYIPYCDAHPQETWEANVLGTEAVLAACAGPPVERFFLASTGAVYKPSRSPHREEDPLEAMDVYGRTKLANEQQIQSAAESGVCRFAVGRIFNAVGTYETNPHLIPELARRIQASNCLEIGNTESRRDYVHARDICAGILKLTLGLNSKIDVCNIGTGRAYSVTEVVSLLAKITGKPIELAPTPMLKRPVDRPVLVADNAKMRDCYGWQPRYTFEQALREALAYAGSRNVNAAP